MGFFRDAANFMMAKGVTKKRRIRDRQKFMREHPPPGNAIHINTVIPTKDPYVFGGINDTNGWRDGIIPPMYGDRKTMNAFWQAHMQSLGTDHLNDTTIGMLAMEQPSGSKRYPGGKDFQPPFKDPHNLTKRDLYKMRMWAGDHPVESIPLNMMWVKDYERPPLAWWGGPYGTLPANYKWKSKTPERLEELRAWDPQWWRDIGKPNVAKDIEAGKYGNWTSKGLKEEDDDRRHKAGSSRAPNKSKHRTVRSPVRKTRKSHRTHTTPSSPKRHKHRSSKSDSKSKPSIQTSRSQPTSSSTKPQSRHGAKGSEMWPNNELRASGPPSIVKGVESFVLPPRMKRKRPPTQVPPFQRPGAPPSSMRPRPPSPSPPPSPPPSKSRSQPSKSHSKSRAPPLSDSSSDEPTTSSHRKPTPVKGKSKPPIPPPSPSDTSSVAGRSAAASDSDASDSDAGSFWHTGSCSTCSGKRSRSPSPPPAKSPMPKKPQEKEGKDDYDDDSGSDISDFSISHGSSCSTCSGNGEEPSGERGAKKPGPPPKKPGT